VFPHVEVRHLHAVIVLAEELSFTRAAHMLNITQPALSKQITEFEEEHEFHLFTRDKRRGVELTAAGRIFVAEAKLALTHAERAIHLARATHDGADTLLTIGHSPYVDPAWVATMMAIRLPSFPNLSIQTTGQLFSTELVRSVIAGELDLAVVTRPPHDAQITAVPFDRAPLYAVFPLTHAAAHKDRVSLQDLANDEWILFGPRVHPLLHDEILNTAKRLGIAPKRYHYILDAQQAVHFVSKGIGVAILTKPTALGHPLADVVAKPLLDKSFCLETSVVMRADDKSLIVNQLVRVFLRRHPPKVLPSQQMDLPLPA